MHPHAVHHQSAPAGLRAGSSRPFHRDWRAWTTLLLCIGGLAAVLPLTQGLDRVLFASALGALTITVYARWRGADDIPTLSAARIAQLTSGLHNVPDMAPTELAQQLPMPVPEQVVAHVGSSQLLSPGAEV